jgi:hypothetical protein
VLADRPEAASQERVGEAQVAVVGSQSILGANDETEIPEYATLSREVDVSAQRDRESSVAGSGGEDLHKPGSGRTHRSVTTTASTAETLEQQARGRDGRRRLGIRRPGPCRTRSGHSSPGRHRALPMPQAPIKSMNVGIDSRHPDRRAVHQASPDPSKRVRAFSMSGMCLSAHPSRTSTGWRRVLPSGVIRYSTATGRELRSSR